LYPTTGFQWGLACNPIRCFGPDTPPLIWGAAVLAEAASAADAAALIRAHSDEPAPQNTAGYFNQT